jgi:hypothetical protein
MGPACGDTLSKGMTTFNNSHYLTRGIRIFKKAQNKNEENEYPDLCLNN